MGSTWDRYAARVILAAVVLGLFKFFAPGGWPWELTSLIAPGGAVAATVVAARRPAKGDPTTWTTFALALGCTLAAEAVWTYYELASPGTTVALADSLRVAGLLLIALGLWQTATRLSPVGDRTGFIDAGALALSATAVAWLFVVEPVSRHSSLNGTGQFRVLLPLALDIAILAMSARLAFALKVRRPAYLLLYLAIGGPILVDVIDSLLETGVGVEVGVFEDFVVISAFCCWILAARARTATVRVESTGVRYLGPRRMVMLISAVTAPLLALVLQEARGEQPSRFALVMIGSVGLTIGVLVAVRVGGLIGTVRDLSDVQNRERFASLVENASDVIMSMDKDGLVTYASPSTKTAFGHPPDSLIGRPLSDLVLADDMKILLSQLARVAVMPERATVANEFRIACRGGGHRLCHAVLSNLLNASGIEGFSVTLRDITAQRSLEDELRDQAFRDALTGLANRALCIDRLEHALSVRAERSYGHLALFFLDLDDFKHVNDGLGHPAGDELLVAVGQRLRECVRSGDTVGRFGGDEFVCLLEHRANLAEVVAVATRIREALALPTRVGTLDLSVRASIGISLAEPGSSAHDMIRDADIAMYEAKSTPTTGYVIFDRAMGAAATDRIELRADLERALERDQFHLVYQPICELASGRIASCEALLRWNHPERGLVSPADFIPLAEQSGQVVALGRWVLERACTEAAAWVAEGHDCPVGVNVSGIQFQDPRFLEQVANALESAHLRPDMLTIEITETAMMSDPDTTADILVAIRKLGVHVAIDDFGTGYCSLAYLNRFAIDSLKIDRAFVIEIEADSTNLLAHAILRLADSLGVSAIAEGIEREAQRANLAAHRCTYGQGFLLSRPLELTPFRQLLADRERASA